MKDADENWDSERKKRPDQDWLEKFVHRQIFDKKDGEMDSRTRLSLTDGFGAV